MKRVYSLDNQIQTQISDQIKQFNLSLDNARQLADAVKQLSDFFITNPDAPTPWEKKWCQLAYLVYYFPLNALRAKAVIEEGNKHKFFSGLKHVYDFGCGMGSGSFYLEENLQTHFIEHSHIAKRFLTRMGDFSLKPPTHIEKNSLSLFSYSLTELEKFPAWALHSEALMLIEPSTQQDGRKLQHLREQLIQSDYSIWAPCLHQLACPMLTHSKKDWCHDRIHFEKPEWFQKMEQHLPFKNNTLTMSYLLARKTKPPEPPPDVVRLVGDQLKEKGRSKQMYCRGTDREFLVWLHRHGDPPELFRGNRYAVPIVQT